MGAPMLNWKLVEMHSLCLNHAPNISALDMLHNNVYVTVVSCIVAVVRWLVVVLVTSCFPCLFIPTLVCDGDGLLEYLDTLPVGLG